MFRKLAAAAAAGLIGGALALAGTAHANHEPPVLDRGEVGECGEVTFLASLPAEPHGSYAVARLVVDDGAEVHLAELGEEVTVGPFDADTTIHYRIFGGGERGYDVPLWNGHEPGPGDWRDSINDYGDEHGWDWTLAGASDENPFVTWKALEVDGCPTDEPTEKPTEEATEEATDPPAPGKGGQEELPVTGAALPVLIGAGLLLLVGGGAAVATARRRRIV